MSAERNWFGRISILLLAGLMSGVVAACDGGLLDVNDPDNVRPEEELSPGAVNSRLAGAVNDFRNAMDWHVLYTGLLTDEYVLAGTFPTRLQVDDRRPLPNNVSILGDSWQNIAVSRATADVLVQDFSGAIGNPDFADVETTLNRGIAFGRLFGGYTRLFMAEFYCQSILGGNPELPQVEEQNAESAPLSSTARAQDALTRFEQAEAQARAIGDDQLINASLVAQARTRMLLGSLTGDPSHFTEAGNLVSSVPDEHLLFVEYSDATPGEENEVFQQSWDVNAGGLRWTVGAGDDADRGFERFAYVDQWIDRGLIIPQSVSESASGADKSAFNGSSPVRLQTLYAGHDGTLSGIAIPLTSGWEARMIEAEVELRAGNPGVAEDIANDLLEDPDQALNPMLMVNDDLAEASGFVTEGLDAFPSVTFGDEPLQGDLVEMARAYESGLWQTGHRQHVLRRFAEEFNDRLALGLWPDKSSVNAITLQVPSGEVENNPNISANCPAGYP